MSNDVALAIFHILNLRRHSQRLSAALVSTYHRHWWTPGRTLLTALKEWSSLVVKPTLSLKTSTFTLFVYFGKTRTITTQNQLNENQHRHNSAHVCLQSRDQQRGWRWLVNGDVMCFPIGEFSGCYWRNTVTYEASAWSRWCNQWLLLCLISEFEPYTVHNRENAF